MQADACSDKPAVVSVTAPDADAGTRVDRFLAEAAMLSRSRVKALIEEGRATRNGVPVREPSEAVRAGMRYALTLPPPEPAAPLAQAIPMTILHEDEHLLVIDKPPGLVTHPAPGNEDGTLVNAVLAHCGDRLPGIGGERRPGIVHRLDKDTSGVMVIAKSEAALASLSASFAERSLERDYLAVAWGLTASAGAWSGPIGRDPRDRKRMAVVSRGGKQARTCYQRLAAHGVAVSLLRCRLETGRTHQIRVHAATAGHPLVGDPVYLRRVPAGAAGLAEPLRSLLLDFPRQALHAAVLGFRHPATGAQMRFETEPPADMIGLLQVLNFYAALHNSA